MALGLVYKFPHELEGHSECESWHRTAGGTGRRLRDAGGVQPDGDMRLEPGVAVGKASPLSGIDLRDRSGWLVLFSPKGVGK